LDENPTEKSARFAVHHRPGKTVDRQAIEKARRSTKESTQGPRKGRELTPLIRGSEVRRIRTRSHPGYTGDVPMTRIGYKVISGESLLELDFLVLIDDVMSDLVGIFAQPMKLPIVVAGRSTTWNPDFLLSRTDLHHELVEVKTEEALHPEDPDERRLVTLRIEAMRKAAAAAGFGFRLATEREIRVQPRLDNARLVHRSMSPFFTKADILTVIAALGRLPERSDVPTLATTLPCRLAIYALPLALCLERLGHLFFDRSLLIRGASSFTKPSVDA